METKNIKFAAYLRFKGHHPDRVVKFSRGKANYFFDKLEASAWESLKQEFDRSEFLTYAQCLDSVIDLAY